MNISVTHHLRSTNTFVLVPSLHFAFFVFVKMGKAPLSRALREIKQLLCVQSLILYYIKQIDSMLPCICPVIDHRGRQKVVRHGIYLLNIPRPLLFSHFVLLGLYRGKVKCQRDGQDVRLAKRRRASILSYPTRTQKLYMHSELSKWLLPQNKCSISNHEFRCIAYYKGMQCSAIMIKVSLNN